MSKVYYHAYIPGEEDGLHILGEDLGTLMGIANRQLGYGPYVIDDVSEEEAVSVVFGNMRKVRYAVEDLAALNRGGTVKVWE